MLGGGGVVDDSYETEKVLVVVVAVSKTLSSMMGVKARNWGRIVAGRAVGL